jgi:hypothetical protein
MLEICIRMELNVSINVMATEISESCKVLILNGLREHDQEGKADKLRHYPILALKNLT